MINKIAVVGANPWGNFLPEFSRANAREYYQWLHQETHLRNINHNCQEQIENYGNLFVPEQKEVFLNDYDGIQFLYLQGKQELLLPVALSSAGLVVVGMPRCRKVCDEIYLAVLPWKEKCLFFWDGRVSRESTFLKKIQREYKLNDKQIVEFKKLPFL